MQLDTFTKKNFYDLVQKFYLQAVTHMFPLEIFKK